MPKKPVKVAKVEAEISEAIARSSRTGHPAISTMRSKHRAFVKQHPLHGTLLTSDFEKHDVGALTRTTTKASDVFVWFIGPTGTHLTWVDLDKPCPQQLLRDLAATWDERDREIYLWDGLSLRPFASADRLCDTLEYERDRREAM